MHIVCSVEKTLKWLARYGLISSEITCPTCHQNQAALIRDNKAYECYIVKLPFYFRCGYRPRNDRQPGT
jgi:hypothetical protein